MKALVSVRAMFAWSSKQILQRIDSLKFRTAVNSPGFFGWDVGEPMSPPASYQQSVQVRAHTRVNLACGAMCTPQVTRHNVRGAKELEPVSSPHADSHASTCVHTYSPHPSDVSSHSMLRVLAANACAVGKPYTMLHFSITKAWALHLINRITNMRCAHSQAVPLSCLRKFSSYWVARKSKTETLLR